MLSILNEIDPYFVASAMCFVWDTKSDFPTPSSTESESTRSPVQTMPHTTHTHTTQYHFREGPPTIPAHAGALPPQVVEWRPRRFSVFKAERWQPPWLDHILKEKSISWICLGFYDQDQWKKACTLLGCSMFATRSAHCSFIQKFYDPCQWKMYPNGKGKDLSRTGCIFWYLRYWYA